MEDPTLILTGTAYLTCMSWSPLPTTLMSCKELPVHTIHAIQGDLSVSKWYLGCNNSDASKISNYDRTKNNEFIYEKEMKRNWFSVRVDDEWNILINQVVITSSGCQHLTSPPTM